MRLPWRLAAIALVAAAAGCASQPPAAPANAVDYDYRLKHPIVVEPTTAVLHLAAVNGALSADDGPRLDTFAGRFIGRGKGALEVSVGAASPYDRPARLLGEAIVQRLLGDGMRVGEVRAQLVMDDPALQPGMALLRFATTTARLPDCYDWSEGERNAPYANFGCAVQHNIGAMVANPQDMIEAEPVGPAAATRVGDGIDKFNQGQATWSVPLPMPASSQPSAGSGGSGGQ